ncbi:hypothetical protein PAAG_11304 [Paracoccidioides lutzii Pb01]|uniref:Uncharacterized protein n=1 Tax=Paracoccidioides lutzii (strain ATCC MYA-826 / Pb01) TaxID=502779 RepID=A0A0A2VM19_PARBA|nr:hypothetical protein PAAG_11304 [Paracoccidioides lutzii Pb01]KGQ01914.1 hypothetical protein PAAG_11304 [Paracoccidioides lutzii Pb01]
MSSMAKYFLRGLASEDIVVSLVNRRRVQIPTAIWLDEAMHRSPDRLMGYPTTLMPLLQKLRALAEDVRLISSSDMAIPSSIIVPSHCRYPVKAYTCRSAALLYLHRLLYPPGNSVEADSTAFGMACEVMAHLAAPAKELKLSL